MLKKFLIPLTLILGLSSFAQPASAFNPEDFSITMAPSSQTLELVSGEDQSGKISITNTGTIPFDFTVKAVPYQLPSDDSGPSFSTVNKYTSLANWITFEQESYHAEPGETVGVPYLIKVPENAVGGGQYAAILAYTEDGVDPDATIKVASQVASILYGRISGLDMAPDGKVVERSIPGFVTNQQFSTSAEIINTGNVDFSVLHSISIVDCLTKEEVLNPDSLNAEGQPIAQQEFYVLPDSSRTSTIVWDNAPKLGIYRVKQNLVFLDEQLEYEQTVIFCPPWLVLAIIGLLLLLILWIALAIRHRKKKAPQVF